MSWVLGLELATMSPRHFHLSTAIALYDPLHLDTAAKRRSRKPETTPATVISAEVHPLSSLQILEANTRKRWLRSYEF